MNKQVSYKIVSLIFAILVICFAIAFYAFSWTGPTAPPPGGNVDPPINIGGTSQYKSGALGIGGVFRAYSNAIIDGNVGIGTTIPSQKLDVDGYIKGRTGLCIGNDCRTTWPAGGVDTRCDTSGTCGQVCIGSDCRSNWEAAICTWNDKTYTTGAKCCAWGGRPARNFFRCEANGTWSSLNVSCWSTTCGK